MSLKEGPFVLRRPVYWRCQLHLGTYWHVEEGKQPGRFHRWMQRLCFGIIWERL